MCYLWTRHNTCDYFSSDGYEGVSFIAASRFCSVKIGVGILLSIYESWCRVAATLHCIACSLDNVKAYLPFLDFILIRLFSFYLWYFTDNIFLVMLYLLWIILIFISWYSSMPGYHFKQDSHLTYDKKIHTQCNSTRYSYLRSVWPKLKRGWLTLFAKWMIFASRE